MEARGKINLYAGSCPHRIITVNLSCGVTPFTIICPNCKPEERGKIVQGRISGHNIDLKTGILYSGFYILNVIPNTTQMEVTVKQGWYRPGKDEFEKLNPEMQDHILNGGLINKPLDQIKDMLFDQVTPEISSKRFQEFCLEVYGRNLKCSK